MTDWSKIAVDSARDDWSPEARKAAAEARKRATYHKQLGQHHLKQPGAEHRAAATAHFEAASAHRSGHPEAARRSNVARSASIRAGVDPRSLESRVA